VSSDRIVQVMIEEGLWINVRDSDFEWPNRIPCQCYYRIFYPEDNRSSMVVEMRVKR